MSASSPHPADRDPGPGAALLRVRLDCASGRASTTGSAAPHDHNERLLAVLDWGTAAAAQSADARLLVLPFASCKDELCQERWEISESVQHTGWRGPVGYAASTRLSFGRIELPLAEDTQDVVQQAYAALFETLDALGQRQLWRVWHFLPDLLRPEGGLTRYQQFCVARHAVWDRHRPGTIASGELPAATVIGAGEGRLTMYWLAARDAVVAIENPRQQSAYRYPAQYGPSSPSFARAVLLPGAAPLLLVSGTAAVVGHASQHPGNALAQTEETLRNLDSLIRHAQAQLSPRSLHRNAAAAGGRFDFLRVYVHPECDPAPVLARLAAAYPGTPLACVRGVICRPELRVEVEGVYRFALST